MKFMSIPGKKWMVTNFNHTVAVARWATIGAWLTFASQTDLNIIINASRNSDFAFNGYLCLPLPIAVRTLVTNNASYSTAGRTGCLKPEDSRALQNLTLSTTIFTCLW
jgi:hypothetical protein